MAYTRAAVERAMKVQEVILRALSDRQPWVQVAEVLGVSARTVRRLRWRYQRYGYDGLLDRRRRVPSARCACGSSGRRAGWGRDGLGTGAPGRGSEGAEGVDVAFAPATSCCAYGVGKLGR